jgi:hypothetical protein
MDVSKVGLGVELSQEDAQGQFHQVAYFSRALTKQERSYRPQTSSKDPGAETSFWTKSDIDEIYSRIRI